MSSVAAKAAEWEEVAKDFNSVLGVSKRNAGQLKKCWSNMKQKWKDESLCHMWEKFKTGKWHIGNFVERA